MKNRNFIFSLVLAMACWALQGWSLTPAQAYGPVGTVDYFGTIPNSANSPLPVLDTTTGTITGGIRKFVDGLPGLGAANANNLGQYIPIANPDTTTYPGSDYYEINLIQYTEKMHSDLPATGTLLRGYVQVNNGTDPVSKANTVTPAPVHYLGPLILATKDRPVRIKFTNKLPTGAGGDLFIPVDTTAMGAGTGPDNPTELYKQNRATLHLHGGASPWISDGTPHQWTTPAGETTSYPKGVSVQDVPDMPPNGPGELTFFYTNQQSGRLMFYHDHAYGITRLNVYAGEAAGYLITDAVEENLISTKKVLPDLGGVYHWGIPLVIQDKTFVPPAPQLAAEDPTWGWAGEGNLWFPHVYMPNQNPADLSGANAMGRWDYGPYFWPPVNGLAHMPTVDPATGNPIPALPNPSLVPEGFMDTPLVNGTAYPTLPIERQAYRFRILNACNDRSLNLQLYYADPVGATLINGGSGYATAPTVTFSGGGAATQATAVATVTNVVDSLTLLTGGSGYTTLPTVDLLGGGGYGATATAIIDANGVVTGVAIVNPGFGYTSAPTVSISGDGVGATASATITGTVTGLTVTNPGSGYSSVPTITFSGGGGSGAVAIASPNTEVKMIPAFATIPPAAPLPAGWPTDGRDGGAPDPATAGPSMIQIGTEGGLLPAPVVIPPQPVNFNYNRRDIVVLNIDKHALMLGPAERADIVVDFSQVPAGVKSLILYNDAPAPVPAFDPRMDYYTGNPDQTATGGAPTTLPGYGPNTRTIMQFNLGTAAPAAPFNLPALKAAFASTATTPGAFAADQPMPLVPQKAYGSAFNTTYPDTFARIQDTSLTFTPPGTATPITAPLLPKAIHELFELDYGRMNAILGVELPLTNFFIQTTLPFGYIDPVTEVVADGQPQYWKITHNGVDTHAIHFHLFDVQLINRVGWDGAIRGPEANEVGWKDTVRMNPLEDCIVAFKPKAMDLPFSLPDSIRPMDPTRPLGSTMGFAGVDPLTGNPMAVVNKEVNLGWEYVWHCHLLGHEENDMMRPVAFQVAPGWPRNVTAVAGDGQATVSFLPPTGTGGSPITGYTLTVNPGGTVIPVAADATSVVVPGLSNCGTPYTFTMTATTANGTSTPSPASLPVTPGPAFNAPTILTVTPGNATTTVTIKAPTSTGCGPVTGYTVTSSPAGGVDSNAGTIGTSHVMTGLTNGTAYTFTVVATNAVGAKSPASAASTPVTPTAPSTRPAAPTALGGVASATGVVPRAITLTWTDNANNETGFTIQRSTNSFFTAGLQTYNVGANVTSFVNNTGLAGNTNYYYRVRARNLLGNSTYSNTAIVKTNP